MEEIVNMIALDASAHEITKAIKNELFAKAAVKMDEMRPQVAASIFNGPQEDDEE